jgi:hypothetical protein
MKIKKLRKRNYKVGELAGDCRELRNCGSQILKVRNRSSATPQFRNRFGSPQYCGVAEVRTKIADAHLWWADVLADFPHLPEENTYSRYKVTLHGRIATRIIYTIQCVGVGFRSWQSFYCWQDVFAAKRQPYMFSLTTKYNKHCMNGLGARDCVTRSTILLHVSGEINFNCGKSAIFFLKSEVKMYLICKLLFLRLTCFPNANLNH